MKKLLISIVALFGLLASVTAQDFVLSNPVLSGTPQKEIVTFDFRATKSYTFSANDLSNEYAIISFSLGSLKPTAEKPKGNGADLFNWVLSENVSKGKTQYTWIGTTKQAKMNAQAKYKISISVERPQGNDAKRRSLEDIMITGQFSDPGSAPSGYEANNFVSANRQDMVNALETTKPVKTL